MKYKIGDKVIFIQKSLDYAWKLKKYEQYEITSRSFDDMGKYFYGVKDKKGVQTTWYSEKDFITIQEDRKFKIKKLESINFNI